MPRPMAWLLLILALTGPLLTLAEAADDQARTLTGSTDEGAISLVDGGVGDDPIVASGWPDGPSVEDMSYLVCDRATFLPDFARPIERMSGRSDIAPVVWPASDRQAWLQVFRD